MRTSLYVVIIPLLFSCSDKGTKTSYYDSGALESEGGVLEGLKHGVWIYYEENGDTAQISTFWNDTLNGIEKTFFNNKVESVTNYVKGLRQGESVTFYPNGILESRGSFEDGYQKGIWEFFHENGELFSRVEMNKGQPTGQLRQFHSNGQLDMLGEDHFGNGIFEKYDSLGRLEWRMRFESGDAIDTLYYDTI